MDKTKVQLIPLIEYISKGMVSPMRALFLKHHCKTGKTTIPDIALFKAKEIRILLLLLLLRFDN